jgi:peptide/nickel transport system substrate-binding protein
VLNRRLTSAALGLAALALVATSCSAGGATGSSTTAAGQTLTIGMPNGSQTDNSNPFMNTSSAMSLGYAFAIYEPLVQVNPIQPTQDPVPWLAESWKWSADFTSITFTIRDGVKWSDGEALTAKDVAYSIGLRKDNDALNTAALPYKDVATEGKTVTVTFKSSQYVNQNKVLNLFVVPEHIWSKITDPTTDLNQNPIGSGPYTLKSWTPQAAILVPNPGYWGGKPAVPELRYTSYNDNNALTTALVNGDAQWGWTFIADYENVYISKDKAHNTFWAPAGLGIDTLYLNTETAPFKDVALRKALNMVIDRAAVHTTATSGVFPQLESITGLPTPAGDDFVASAYAGKKFAVDVAGAKKVLADAGYTLDGSTLKDPSGTAVTFTLTDPTGWSDYLTSLQLIADAVKPLGITATVEGMNADAWFTAIANGDFQATMHWTDSGATPWDMYSDIMDGAQYVALGQKANWNFGRFQDAGATKALATFATSPDEATRKTALDAVQKVFVEQVPAIGMVARPTAAEYSTKNYVGWPSADDPYNQPQPTGPQASQILMKLKPASK